MQAINSRTPHWFTDGRPSAPPDIPKHFRSASSLRFMNSCKPHWASRRPIDKCCRSHVHFFPSTFHSWLRFESPGCTPWIPRRSASIEPGEPQTSRAGQPALGHVIAPARHLLNAHTALQTAFARSRSVTITEDRVPCRRQQRRRRRQRWRRRCRGRTPPPAARLAGANSRRDASWDGPSSGGGLRATDAHCSAIFVYECAAARAAEWAARSGGNGAQAAAAAVRGHGPAAVTAGEMPPGRITAGQMGITTSAPRDAWRKERGQTTRRSALGWRWVLTNWRDRNHSDVMECEESR